MNTTLPFAKAEVEQSIVARWQRVMDHFSERIAVATPDGEAYTYQVLDAQANQIAHALCARLGVDNVPVTLLLDHTPQLVATIIGVLKANKAYVILDPSQTDGRLESLMATAAAPLLVTTTQHQTRATAIAGDHQAIMLLETVAAAETALALPISPHAPAALFFTSGTEQESKGVCYTHRMILHRIWVETTSHQLNATAHISGLRTFDMAAGLRDLFNALLNGGMICLYAVKQHGLNRLSAWLVEQEISYFHLPILLYREWLDTLTVTDYFPAIRQLFPSGRKTVDDLQRVWPHLDPLARFISTYATTETSLLTQEVIDRQTPIASNLLSVGTAIPDKEIILLNSEGQPVPVGESGEIVVRSRYIAQGYWQQPSLTAQRFQVDKDGGELITYHTGDLGRFRPDGALELVGRQDSQVKLRGYRVVLSAVEDALRALPMVKEAVVTADEEQGLLVAYLLAATDPPVSPAAIRATLAQRLPHYSLPTHIIYLPHFPLLASGKVNRRALPAPEQHRVGLTTPFVPPCNEQEAQLVAIWEGLLAVHPVGVQDNFFDLGGHSIAAMRLLYQIEQQFQQPVALRAFIFNPTIAHLATLLGETSAATTTIASPVENLSPPEDERLRTLYDTVREQIENRPLLPPLPPNRLHYPRRLCLLQRLPQPVAMRLWAWLVQRSPIQRRYFSQESALVQAFIAGMDQPINQQKILARCLFFGSIVRYGMREALFPHLAAANAIRVEGQELLAAARTAQQGVILLRTHNYQNLYLNYIDLWQLRIRRMRRVIEQSQHDRVTTEHVLYTRQLELTAQALRQGGVVTIGPDVNHGHGTQITAPLYGRLRPFRTSFAELALLTNAQLFFVASDLADYNRFSFRLLGPFDLGSSTMSHAARVEYLLEQYLTHLHQQWACAPWAIPWQMMSEHLAYPPVAT